MSGNIPRAARVAAILAILLALILTPAALSQTQDDIVRVEQDWELVVGTPAPNCNSPQVTCVISPAGDLESVHAALEMNVQTLGCYAPGGMQLQLWDGAAAVSDRNSYSRGILSTSGETITWTQRMEVRDGELKFEVVNGTSVTWGEFGRWGLFYVNTSTALANLNDYDTEVSVRGSGIGFAENRVQSLTIKKVRCYTAAGVMTEDTEPKIVFSQN